MGTFDLGPFWTTDADLSRVTSPMGCEIGFGSPRWCDEEPEAFVHGRWLCDEHALEAAAGDTSRRRFMVNPARGRAWWA